MPRTYLIPSNLAGQTLAAALRQLAGPLTWSEARRLIEGRHVRIGGTVCLDDARRLNAGEQVSLGGQPSAPTPREQDVRVLHIDADLIVVEKPAGIQTVRRHEERRWPDDRKRLQPTLDEMLQRMLPGLLRAARHESVRPNTDAGKGTPRVRPVHRLDQDTSGLMLFALSAPAQTALVKMFAAHEVRRTYLAVVHGQLAESRTIESWLVRDRGDGQRGSSPTPSPNADARHAITHVRPLEHFARCTLIECRLETGRTHQIRIHLSEIGHPLCGEKRYTSQPSGTPPRADESGAPRQVLHSCKLELAHPMNGERMSFDSPLPRDLSLWLERLRKEV